MRRVGLWTTHLYISRIPCYRLLDASPARRIIKDVMRHQKGTEEKAKKSENKNPETGFEGWNLWLRAVAARDEIDPLEFFDPDEFTAKGRGDDAARP